MTIDQAAAQLGVSVFTIRRWLRDGLLPGEQAAPSAPWRIRLSDDTRARFVPEIPDGYLSLADAARALGCARQTVLHKVQRGELHAIHIPRPPQRACHQRPRPDHGPTAHSLNGKVHCEPRPGGPSRTTFSRPARKSSWPRCSTVSRRIEV
jgi:excisionase family DNA binding protein